MAEGFDDFEKENFGKKYPEYDDMDITDLESNYDVLNDEIEELAKINKDLIKINYIDYLK